MRRRPLWYSPSQTKVSQLVAEGVEVEVLLLETPSLTSVHVSGFLRKIS
jgi:hypothetical protein